MANFILSTWLQTNYCIMLKTSIIKLDHIIVLFLSAYMHVLAKCLIFVMQSYIRKQDYEHMHEIKTILLVCAWEDQKGNQCSVSSVLYGKYSTVVSTYSTVILILVCNQCSKQPALILLPVYVDSRHPLKWLHKSSKPAQCAVQIVVYLLSLLSLQPAPGYIG